MNNNQKTELDIEMIESLLLRRLGGRIRDLSVRIVRGELILEGQTATYHGKQLAQHAAIEVTGLSIQSNNIEVN